MYLSKLFLKHKFSLNRYITVINNLKLLFSNAKKIIFLSNELTYLLHGFTSSAHWFDDTTTILFVLS